MEVTLPWLQPWSTVQCLLLMIILISQSLWAGGLLSLRIAGDVLGISLGTLLGMILIPERPQLQSISWQRFCGAFIVVVVSAAILLLPWVRFAIWPSDCRSCGRLWHSWLIGVETLGGYQCGPNWEYVADAASVCFMSPLAVACISTSDNLSPYVRNAMWFVATTWLYMVVWMVEDLSDWCKKGGQIHAAAVINGVMFPLGNTLDCVLLVWTALLVLRRAQQLEAHSGTSADMCLTLSTGRKAYWLIAVLGIASGVSRFLRSRYHYLSESREWMKVSGIFAAVVALVWFFFSVALWRAFAAKHKLLSEEVQRTSGVPQALARWALRSMNWEAAALVPMVLIKAAYWTVAVLWGMLLIEKHSKLYFGHHILQRLTCAIEGLLVAMLSGALCQAFRKPRRDEVWNSAESMHRRSHTEMLDETVWNGKVDELTNRGFTLDRLLHFLEDLVSGQVMPSFRPHLSKTNDVVRQAIIPLTRAPEAVDGGCALSTAWNQGQPLPAEIFVTHAWSNNFVHLVAGILASCLGHESYDFIAAILVEPDGFARVRKMLLSKESLETTIWLCAISVNQHASICGSFGPATAEGTLRFAEWQAKHRDTVTGEVFQLCSCHQPKFSNDQPDQCELNKFDDMMLLLSKRLPRFSQVIVVDEPFLLFSRAWCVAEVVEGSLLGISQDISIHSENSVANQYHSLVELDVRNCQASRPEDKESILDHIGDIEAFNQRLQRLIFDADGLFSSFTDGCARARMVGQMVKRISRARSSESTLHM
eukprot:TRINITY_DN7803_c0_g1_i7.p1 TRINITY_DN7803_c0_g1~~TRINITY_DN7803_c0_g1_i7.p1  ORF type:complete len:763 (-),score=89.08 TRINITY_DN7803_c0_g1_i7:362-2650(-)